MNRQDLQQLYRFIERQVGQDICTYSSYIDLQKDCQISDGNSKVFGKTTIKKISLDEKLMINIQYQLKEIERLYLESIIKHSIHKSIRIMHIIKI